MFGAGAHDEWLMAAKFVGKVVGGWVDEAVRRDSENMNDETETHIDGCLRCVDSRYCFLNKWP